MTGELCTCAGVMYVFSALSDSEEGSMWDLWALDWIQQRAECLRFCIGQFVTPMGQLPVSNDIEYEFDTRNPYNFLQVTYYKVSYSYGASDLNKLVSICTLAASIAYIL